MRLTSGPPVPRPGWLRGLASALLLVTLAAGMAPAVHAAPIPEPKVVVVVGPVGSLTDEYRAAATRAARAARRHTSNVVTIYSPNATWPVVREALQGASIVVYLGHGNGWPSRYRDELFPPTQNGLGLNPVAGEGDSAHQYFGEAYLARDVRLAPHAVVVLHRLCYASGNTEPGLPEGSFDKVQQRADNFAAGFLAAGADAVIADAFFEPDWYVNAILRGRGTIESIWRRAPSFHDHVIAFPSTRSPGRNVLLDPTRPAHGFYRSLVGRLALRPSEVVASRTPAAARAAQSSTGTVPSLAVIGATFSAPVLAPTAPGATTLVAAGKAALTLPVRLPAGASLPKASQLGVRWDPIETTPDPVALRVPETSPDPAATSQPSATPDPAADPASSDPPSIDHVVPEVIGEVVTISATSIGPDSLVATVDLPATPGRYRLVTTVHGADGTAYDAATQALVASLIVRVSPQVSVAFGVAPEIRLVAGESTTAAVRVANDGAVPWTAPKVDQAPRGLFVPPDPPSFVMAGWMAIGVGVDTSNSLTAAEVELLPGEETVVQLPLVAPDAPGTYLVLLDLLTPGYGSLDAAGLQPVTIRVVVEPAPPTSPGPDLRAPSPL